LRLPQLDPLPIGCETDHDCGSFSDLSLATGGQLAGRTGAAEIGALQIILTTQQMNLVHS
jgi:hypothetical protein